MLGSLFKSNQYENLQKKLKRSYDSLNYQDYLETSTKLLRIAPNKPHIIAHYINALHLNEKGYIAKQSLNRLIEIGDSRIFLICELINRIDLDIYGEQINTLVQLRETAGFNNATESEIITYQDHVEKLNTSLSA